MDLRTDLPWRIDCQGGNPPIFPVHEIEKHMKVLLALSVLATGLLWAAAFMGRRRNGRLLCWKCWGCFILGGCDAASKSGSAANLSSHETGTGGLGGV